MIDSLSSDNTHSAQPDSNAKPGPEGTKEIDLGAGLQAGLEALGKALSGIVKAAKDAVGPELLKNLAAGQLFQQIATCLDETVAALAEKPVCPPQKIGQLTCYLERLDAEIQGSKFESQQSSLRVRMEGVLQALSEPNPRTVDRIAEAAGYFRAAASSATPVSGEGPVHFEYKA